MHRLLWFVAAALAAQTGGHRGDPPYLIEGGWTPLLNGKDLSGWKHQGSRKGEWATTKAVVWDAAKPEALTPTGGPGDRIVNGPAGKIDNLVTANKYGDVELYVEFMMPKGSNSGVYLHGLYEVQVFDSWGVTDLKTADCGAIYHRWIDNKPVGGSLPKVNASRAPGQWQSFHIWFRAPRFDGSGKKVENAKFLRVLHNGVLVQEKVDLEGPTRAHMDLPEAARNPIMLQGDHGPVAYRNVYVKRIEGK